MDVNIGRINNEAYGITGSTGISGVAGSFGIREKRINTINKINKNMKNRTFEEIVNHPYIADGTEVEVRLGSGSFQGKVVGQSKTGLMPYYIIECIDGSLPNETYEYKFVSMPMSEIFVK